MTSRTLYQLTLKNFIMRMGIVVALLFAAALIPLTMSDASAKCINVDNCINGPVFFSLKDQVHNSFLLQDITCPNQNHLLTERPNGNLACITEHMAESTGWQVHHENVVDTKGMFLVAQFENFIHHVPFEITGATLDDMTFQDEMLTVHVTPNAEHGMLSVTLPFGFLQAKMEYCDPQNKADHPSAPFVVVADGIEYGYQMGENSRGSPALNIPLDENTSTVDIIRTCYGG